MIEVFLAMFVTFLICVALLGGIYALHKFMQKGGE